MLFKFCVENRKEFPVAEHTILLKRALSNFVAGEMGLIKMKGLYLRFDLRSVPQSN